MDNEQIWLEQARRGDKNAFGQLIEAYQGPVYNLAYRMLANSGAGLVVVEATHVERHGRITHGCAGLYSDANEAAFRGVIEHCKRIGTARLGVQLAHAGRKASSQRPWGGGGPLKGDQDPWPTIAPAWPPGWCSRSAIR